MSAVELTAATLALACVVLAMRVNPLSWIAAFVSAALYASVFFDSRLYTEAAFQIVVMGLSISGFRKWSQGAKEQGGERGVLPISRLGVRYHAAIALSCALVGSAVGGLLAVYSDSDVPYLDANITVFSVVATFLGTRKILENWLYWLVIDIVSSGVYIFKGLWITAVLYGVYVVLAWLGYTEWRERWRGMTT